MLRPVEQSGVGHIFDMNLVSFLSPTLMLTHALTVDTVEDAEESALRPQALYGTCGVSLTNYKPVYVP